MKFLPLIWRNVWRRKFRTTFTLLSIFVAFLLFGILMTIRMSFDFGVQVAGLDRLVIIHKVSLIMPLPLAYKTQLEQTPGVEIVSALQRGLAACIRIQPTSSRTWRSTRSLFSGSTGVRDPARAVKAWLADRQGAIVGRDLATRFGWNIGDRIPLIGTIWQPNGGGQTWEFNIVGIYDGGDGVDKTQMFFRYDYLTRTAGSRRGRSAGISSRLPIPTRPWSLSRTFDEMFANSSAETKTTTEKGFVEGFAKQIGDIGAIMIAISSTVLFMFGLVAASTMAQSVRERTSEIAVLKTLGFTDASILFLVLTESLFIVLVGGGLGLGWPGCSCSRATRPGGMLPIFTLPPRDVVIGVALMVAMGVLAGMVPALSAMRLSITDALRRV
jgi:putative ABC transport system permease protein